jgi:hypothetical protein
MNGRSPFDELRVNGIEGGYTDIDNPRGLVLQSESSSSLF